MKLTRVSDQIVEIIDFPRTVVALGLFMVLGTWGFGLKAVIDGSWELKTALVRILFATLIAGGATMSFWERSRFRFDGNQQTLTWSRTGPFRKMTGGEAHFDQIHRVEIESTSDKFRVALIIEGHCLPITESYSAGIAHQQQCEELRSVIESLLACRTYR
jgi:hypothetical protein